MQEICGVDLLVAKFVVKTTHSRCFNNVLRDTNQTKVIPPWWDTGLIGSYKFYLAFENAIHCTDYVSEKFWRNSLRAGAVPIVYGPNKDKVLATFQLFLNQCPEPTTRKMFNKWHHRIALFLLKTSKVQLIWSNTSTT